MLPLRREKDILIEELPGETLIYDQKRHKIHCLNQTAALIWRHCDGHTSIAEIAQLLRKQADLPESEELIQLTLCDLAKRRLLQDHQQYQNAEAARWSRRDFARKLGVAAVLVPAVMSVMAPTAMAAFGSGAIGSSCTTNAECAPDVFGNRCCCQNASGGQGIKNTCTTVATCGGNNNCAPH